MPAKKVTEETVSDKQTVTLTKDSVSYTLADPVMVAALKNQGYVEV